MTLLEDDCYKKHNTQNYQYKITMCTAPISKRQSVIWLESTVINQIIIKWHFKDAQITALSLRHMCQQPTVMSRVTNHKLGDMIISRSNIAIARCFSCSEIHCRPCLCHALKAKLHHQSHTGILGNQKDSPHLKCRKFGYNLNNQKYTLTAVKI